MLGFFSFTEVTDPTAHQAYNEWHQLDHLPEQFSIEGISFGQRWVCSPRCAEARVAVSPQLAPCHYMTLYLLRDATVLSEFFALAKELHRADRFFAARQAHLTGPYEVTARQAAPRVKVSAAGIPHRPAQGVYVTAGPPVPQGHLLAHDGVAGEWHFAELDPDGTARVTAGRHITVAFVDGDLLPTAAALGQACQDLGTPLEWAGPLERVDPKHWGWFG